MEPRMLLATAATLFGVAATGGLIMAAMRLRGTARPPISLAMGHGLLAAAGLTLMIYAALLYPVPRLVQFSLLLFVLAAGDGVVMNLRYHWRVLPLPMPLMVVHAALAVGGFGLLVVSLF